MSCIRFSYTDFPAYLKLTVGSLPKENENASQPLDTGSFVELQHDSHAAQPKENRMSSGRLDTESLLELQHDESFKHGRKKAKNARSAVGYRIFASCNYNMQTQSLRILEKRKRKMSGHRLDTGSLLFATTIW
ncbi:hypothetical protein BaRGS_00005932 [Batillaria attramentaria]|uniref:Uncharacterized protein n=1 Tax=Batillaria attramentaria TaxID=370345 RepID=A0ABD0LT90_9CAEN